MNLSRCFLRMIDSSSLVEIGLSGLRDFDFMRFCIIRRKVMLLKERIGRGGGKSILSNKTLSIAEIWSFFIFSNMYIGCGFEE
jgi:hypothetical protein